MAVGDFSGGLDYRPFVPQADESAWSFPAHRGKVQQISATPDRQHLLFLDEQRGARLWDIKERTCRRLPDTYRAGVFIDKSRMVLIPNSNAAEYAGRLILADQSGNRVGMPFFSVSSEGFKIPSGIPFERLAISEGGSRVAAASDAAKDPLVCVWETKSGRLTHWITTDRLEDPVLALAFSSDGRYLLTGGESHSARLWDLSVRPGELDVPCVTFSDPSVKANVTCVAIRPGHSDQVVTGHSDGEVHAWKWQAGGAVGVLDVPRLIAREFSTEVKALSFTHDGRYLAAAGDGKRIWIGTMDPRPRRVDLLDRLGPHHDEQINALSFWRGGDAANDRPMLLSGSDDTTIRLWDLGTKALSGTFSAANRPAGSDQAINPDVDWVLYTPESLYDASAEAVKLVQYRRPSAARRNARGNPVAEPAGLSVGLRRQEEAGQVDQLAATHFQYGLGEQLLWGVNPAVKTPKEPPPIVIGAPPRIDQKNPEARLTITLGASDFQNVRLYHNDVPIPSAWAVGDGPNPLSVEVSVKLLPGNNRFYAMAGREGAYDSCSRVVEFEFEGPMKRGQVHVIALGVQNYGRRSLRFAEDDADQLSDLIHARGVDAEGKVGIRRVLHGSDINQKSLDAVFREIARRVEDRPEDTVVVFLAGHTGVFDPQRFCLLLPTFQFPEQEPIQVASRGPAGISENEKVDPRSVLPYSSIEVNLARLKALNRLVIVDACQAESILDDPQVRGIRKWMDLSSRRARTSYLMAARRGELAQEVARLTHGLFTYTLLRGMRALELVKEPKEVAELKLPPDADFNRDGVVSTDELDAYARQVLPRLTRLFPQQSVASRAGGADPVPRGDGAPSAIGSDSNTREVRFLGTDVSFPLVPVGETSRTP